MQIVSNPIITIIINNDGDIQYNSTPEYNLFKNCKNLFEIEQFNKYKHVLTSNFSTKTVLINLFKYNYTVIKIPLPFNLTQYIFEKWRINNIIPTNQPNTNQTIFENLKDITKYSQIEQEVVYCLLNNVIQNKDIYNLISQYNPSCTERNIRFAIEQLYKKFDVNTKSSLIYSLKAHDLDMYLPKTIFKPCILVS